MRRGEIVGRLDPHFHQPRFKELVSALERIHSRPLKEMVERASENWNKTDGRFIAEFPYIEISGIEIDGDAYSVNLLPVADAPSRAQQVVRTNDILVSLTRPHRGAIAQVRPEDDGAIASTGFAVLRSLRANEIDRRYLLLALSSPFGLQQMLMRSSGGNYPAITEDELDRILLPLPPLAKQRELVDAMEAARAARRAKLAEADALLAGMDAYLLDTLGLAPPPETPRRVFAIRANQLTNALNAERYGALRLEKLLTWNSSVSDAVELVEGRILPSRDGPTEEWDWIRIDDLPNRPWQVDSLRTALGAEIEGALYPVRENDILLARLGPTILNAKFVLAPKPVRQTVASPEFLVLRCKQDWEPEVVLWLLRMKLFRDIMYLRSRGGTPSRYRLDGDDLLSIAFPRVADLPQAAIAAEIRRRRERARSLRAEAETGWAQAKRWFEEQLLGTQQNLAT